MVLKKIGIDVENGDEVNGESVTERMVPAIRRFANENQGVELFLHGHLDRIHAAFGMDLPVQATVVPASEFYTQGQALKRRLKGSALNNLVKSVHEGNIDGFFTAGDTSKVAFEAGKIRVREVGSQALVALFPSKENDYVVSDVGFTNQTSKKELYVDAVDSWARSIYGQGIMSSVYLNGRGIVRPKWGLLSIGTEDHKGSDVDRRLEGLIQQGIEENGLGEFMEYVGKVEPVDCFGGKVDVALADGYKGNMFLKVAEETLGLMKYWVNEEVAKFSLMDRVRLAFGSRVLRRVKENLLEKANPDRYSAALVLGYEGIVVKGHGAASSDSMYYGIQTLADCNHDDSGRELTKAVKKYMPKE